MDLSKNRVTPSLIAISWFIMIFHGIFPIVNGSPATRSMRPATLATRVSLGRRLEP